MAKERLFAKTFVILQLMRMYGHMFRCAAVCVLVCAWLSASGAGTAAARQAVERFAASRLTDAGKVAVMVVDLEDGTVLGEHNADTPLVPASIMKAVTIGTLLRETGVDYRYRTPVYADGDIRDGVLEGNIVVVGSGDPSLNSRRGPESADIVAECVDALRRKGIERVEGRIIVDNGIFTGPATPPSWASGDLRQAYGAGSFGLNFENNASGGSSVPNPGNVFVARLRNAMARAGIGLGEADVSGGSRRLLAEHLSPTIDEIMRSCMMRSDNMYAESLLRTYALLRGHEGATEAGARLERDYWRSQLGDTDGVRIVDGSGLSRQNRVTAGFMADVLAEMSGDVNYVSFFPLAGQEGTLRKFLADTPLDSYVALKTGSMSGIQCYAGYKLDDNYAPTHAVVVIINGMTAARADVRREVERMLLDVFDQSTDTDGQE